MAKKKLTEKIADKIDEVLHPHQHESELAPSEAGTEDLAAAPEGLIPQEELEPKKSEEPKAASRSSQSKQHSKFDKFKKGF